MSITDVKIKLVENENSKVLAVASIIIDNEFAINGIRIVNGNYNVFVSMPSKKDKDGAYYDIVYPINLSAKEMICNKILEEYNKIKEEN